MHWAAFVNVSYRIGRFSLTFRDVVTGVIVDNDDDGAKPVTTEADIAASSAATIALTFLETNILI